jgi:hypothetical protein
MKVKKNEVTLERALEKAAKMICTMKLGLCPLRESNFTGCPSLCQEDTLPWQCWVAHFRQIAVLA